MPRWRNQLDEVGTLRWFATSPMLKVELTCLQALSDLDQMEDAWLEVISAGDLKYFFESKIEIVVCMVFCKKAFLEYLASGATA